MPNIGNLSQSIIDSILRINGLSPTTHDELRQFLSGQPTNVSNTEEFTSTLKSITQDVDVGLEAKGAISGEIIGALEGGLVIGKGMEIASELSHLIEGNREANRARERARQSFRDRVESKQPVGGFIFHDVDLKTPTPRNPKERRPPEDRKFTESDPLLRQRRPVDDGSGDVDTTPQVSRNTRGVSGNLQRGVVGSAIGTVVGSSVIASLITPVSTLKFKPPPHGSRKHENTTDPPNDNQGDTNNTDHQGEPPRERKHETFEEPEEPTKPETVNERGTTTEFNKGEEKQVKPDDIDNPMGVPLLRPEFLMVGTEYFDKRFNVKRLEDENEEWADFDYVPRVDITNGVDVDNQLGAEIRFREPLFIPKYQAPLKPPTKLAVEMSQVPMRREIQISQPWEDKFDGSLTGKIELTETYSHSAFDVDFYKLKLYNPV